MDESTQQNAAMVEQVAAASEALGEQSNELNQMMSFFSLSSNEKPSSYDGQEQRSSNRPWSEGDSSSSKPTLNIAAAKSKHLSWKTRIRSFLDGKESLTMKQAVSHRDCDLGKWIYSEGITHLGESDTFNKLEKCHAGLHADIKEIISLKDQGKNSQAEDHYRNIESASGKVVRYLSTIEKELISGSNKDISDNNAAISSK
jgi:methyl-accepting chemotaxis protein